MTKKETLSLIKYLRKEGAISISISDDKIDVQFPIGGSLEPVPMPLPQSSPPSIDNALWEEFVKSELGEDS